MDAAAPANSVAVMVGFLLGLLCLFTDLLDNLDVVVEDGGNHRDHVGLDDAGPDGLCAPNSYVDHALKGQIPLPHVHHILAPPLLQDADQPLDAAIDGEDVANSTG